MNSEYEFTHEQNSVISSLVMSARVAGGLLLTTAAWKGYRHIVIGSSVVTGALIAAFYGFLGVWTLKAAGAFDNVVKTQGSDIANLDLAFVELRRVFRLTRTACVIFLVAFGLLFLALLAGISALSGH
jgi:hypothetical protein